MICCIGSIPAYNFRLGRLMLTEWSLIIIIATLLVKNVGLRLFLYYVVIRNIIGYWEALHMPGEGYNIYTQTIYVTTQTMLLAILAYEGVKRWINRDNTVLLLDLICLAAILQTTVMIMQCNGLWIGLVPRGINSFIYLGYSHYNITGLTSNANMAGSFLALSLPAFFRTKRYVFIPLVLTGLWLSHSMGGMVPAAVFLFIFALIKCPKRLRIPAVLTCAAIATLFYLRDPHLVSGSRFKVYKVVAINLITMKPIIGWGTGQFQHAFRLIAAKYFHFSAYKDVFRQLHNEPLQLYFEYGIIGLALIATSLIQIIKNGVHSKYRFILYGALLIGAINSCVNFLFHTVVCVIFLIYCAILEGDKNEFDRHI